MSGSSGNETTIRIGAQDDTGKAASSAAKRMEGLKGVAKTATAGLATAGAAAGAMFISGMAKNMNAAVLNDKLASQLGLTEKTAAVAGKAAAEVYGDNFGASMEDVNDAIKAVGTNIGDLSTMTQSQIEGMTKSALTYSSVMGKDVNLSTEAVGSMLKNGLAKNATEAFDILTAGSQQGVDKAEDLLETFQEYSPQFAKLGIDGKGALDLLSSGLKAGARDTDVIADAFKEFSIRSIDGSALTAQGFKAAGLDAKEMAKEIGKGGESARDATQKTLEGLLAIKDPVKQNIAGTALFGTQWEDTVRQILPALANADGAIKNVDGSTEKMADQMGSNAQAKIDTMKRSFEQWTMNMAASDSQVGLLATGVANFGEQGLTLAANLGTVAVAFKALGVAMLANPIGITIVALVALGVALTVLWQKSQKAREIMSTVFSVMAEAILFNVSLILKAARIMALGILDSVGHILHAMAKIPGPTQDAAKKAAKSFDKFRDGVDKSLTAAENKVDEWRHSVNNMPKVIKLKGEISDLKSKVDQAKAKLKTVPASRRARLQADISQLTRQIRLAQDKINRLHGKTIVTTLLIQEKREAAGRGRNVPGFEHGGIIGAATGGARGGLVMVGEHGRELVRLPYGSQVMPNGTTENLVQARRDDIIKALHRRPSNSTIRDAVKGQPVADQVVRVLIEGTGLLTGIRKEVRVQGGNVQTVLGSR